jgi:hypothetical protein
MTGPHYVSNGSSPTIVPKTAAGVGATASLANSNDTCGNITVTTGTGSTVGVIATVTFAVAYANAPVVLINQAGPAGFQGAFANGFAATFDVVLADAPSDGTAYLFHYIVAGQ